MKITGLNESPNISGVLRDNNLIEKKLPEKEQTGKKQTTIDNKDTKTDKKEITREELDYSLAQFNETVKVFHKNLKFRLHEESGRMYVEVFNTNDSTVIKTIPAEDMLDMLGRIKEMVGLIIDEKR